MATEKVVQREAPMVPRMAYLIAAEKAPLMVSVSVLMMEALMVAEMEAMKVQGTVMGLPMVYLIEIEKVAVYFGTAHMSLDNFQQLQHIYYIAFLSFL